MMGSALIGEVLMGEVSVQLTLWERTTRTGSPFWQDTSSALLELSNFWSNDCTCGAWSRDW